MKIKANVTFKFRYMIVTPSVREIRGKCVADYLELMRESRRTCEKGIKRSGHFALSNAVFYDFFITLAGCCFLSRTADARSGQRAVYAWFMCCVLESCWE